MTQKLSAQQPLPQKQDLQASDFKNRFVRDLIWLLNQPSLCHCTVERWQIPTPSQDELLALDRNPAPLEHWLQQSPSKRLGHYVEQLWLFYLSYHKDITLLAHNKVIQGPKRTLGEFDLILKDKRDHQVWHIELAIKFYLGSQQAWGEDNRWSHWLGPNCKDTMDHKWHKLIQQQLTLGQRPDVIAQLEAEHLRPQQSASLTRGILFYPGEAPYKLISPAHINPEHTQGHWYYYSDWLNQTDESSRWFILKKPHWLALPIQPEWQIKEDIMAEMASQIARKQPIYLAEENGRRVFVVPEQWPDFHPLPWHYLYPEFERLDR